MPTNLSTLDSPQIQDHFKNHSLKICVIGIGRIGLPTALCFAKAGFETIGVDINEKMILNFLAVRYHGQSKEDVEAEHMENRRKLIELGEFVPVETEK